MYLPILGLTWGVDIGNIPRFLVIPQNINMLFVKYWTAQRELAALDDSKEKTTTHPLIHRLRNGLRQGQKRLPILLMNLLMITDTPFRLWHELEDKWMWWGPENVSADDYKKFFVLTRKKIMSYAPAAQILWGYGPDSHWNEEKKFMSRYPGDEYVDIIGYDDYQIADPQKFERELDLARMVSAIAKKHGKIAALFESANKNAESVNNYYASLLRPLLADSLVHFGLVQIWGSGKFENELQYQDRRNFLNQDFILKVK